MKYHIETEENGITVKTEHHEVFIGDNAVSVKPRMECVNECEHSEGGLCLWLDRMVCRNQKKLAVKET